MSSIPNNAIPHPHKHDEPGDDHGSAPASDKHVAAQNARQPVLTPPAKAAPVSAKSVATPRSIALAVGGALAVGAAAAAATLAQRRAGPKPKAPKDKHKPEHKAKKEKDHGKGSEQHSPKHPEHEEAVKR